jgi:hypothetical protein
MKKLGLVTLITSLGVVAHAQLIDDFSGTLASYTSTRILNNGAHAPVNTSNWEITGGLTLQLNTSAFTGIEQYALTRTDFTLAVGYELSATFGAGFTGPQDIGLNVGAGTPTVDVRQNYVNVYIRNNGQLFSRGFNGTTEFALGGGATPATISSLFIARTATDVFELGFYDGALNRTIVSTRTIGAGNAAGIGNSIGFYADIRGQGIVGAMDNLTLTAVPEPSTMALAGMGALGLFFRLRRK